MNDRFKFRAWYPQKRWVNKPQMIYPEHSEYVCVSFHGEVCNIGDGDLWSDDGMPILMQSTGLKDKNGVLIFEGDIVNYKVNGKEVTDQVVFISCFFGVDKYTGMLAAFDGLEVIGNIHENPELLKNDRTLSLL